MASGIKQINYRDRQLGVVNNTSTAVTAQIYPSINLVIITPTVAGASTKFSKGYIFG